MKSVSNPKLNTIGPILIRALIAGVIAAVINLFLFFVGGAVVGGIDIDLEQIGEFTPMPFFLPIIASILPMLIAGLGLWIARRFMYRGNQVFIGVAAILTILSLASPFTGNVATMNAALVLALMHLVVGGVMIFYLAK